MSNLVLGLDMTPGTDEEYTSSLTPFWWYDTRLRDGTDSNSDILELVGNVVDPVAGDANMTVDTTTEANGSYGSGNPDGPVQTWADVSGVSLSSLVWNFVCAWDSPSGDNWTSFVMDNRVSDTDDDVLEVRFETERSGDVSYTIFLNMTSSGGSFFGIDGQWDDGAMGSKGVVIISVDPVSGGHSAHMNGVAMTNSFETPPIAGDATIINEAAALTFNFYQTANIIRSNPNVGTHAPPAGVPWDAIGMALCRGVVTDITEETNYWASYFGVNLTI